MSVLTRSMTLGVLALGLGAAAVAAQEKPRVGPSFRWYLGAQGGVYNFQTTSQTRGWLPSVGGNLMVVARKTGLLLQVDEVLGSDETGVYPDSLAPGGQRTASFNNIRRYSAHVFVMPFRWAVEPYFGVGGGIAHAVNVQPLGTAGLAPGELDAVYDEAADRSSFGFVSFLAGVQLRAGPVVVFGQYHANSSPGRGNVFTGGSHLMQAGVRVSMGRSREDLTENR
jgi:hypothetical protein